MIDENLTELRSFNIDLRKNKNLEIVSDEINKLIDSGFKTVTVKIYGSSKDAAVNLGNDKSLFENIKNVQSLPDNVVYDFLKSRGSLADSDLMKRMSNER
ncbi:MAG: hypothetical protein A2068_09640 [Ignavibacteria bacterium GWB2_35_6b]|nr:MAG: hypothetical protein A2068_09640 [Ignavibacteria bacterium GWB2_35_6b]